VTCLHTNSISTFLPEGEKTSSLHDVGLFSYFLEHQPTYLSRNLLVRIFLNFVQPNISYYSVTFFSPSAPFRQTLLTTELHNILISFLF
jgi:hypothetical protein